MNINQAFLKSVHHSFTSMKKLADKTMEQLNNNELHFVPNEESNSIAVLVNHLSGNMKSRFTDFLTSDGEKPDRNRDGEFEGGYQTKEELIQAWNKGWDILFKALSDLKEEDILKTVYIRNEPHSVLDALQRQVAHYSNHIGQMIYIGKAIKDSDWKCLSVPRGFSKTFTEEMKEKYK